MFSQFAKRSTHFLFRGKKRKTYLHVYILSVIDLFSVLLTLLSSNKETLRSGSMSLLPTIGKRKRVFRFARFYFRISPSLMVRGKQAVSLLFAKLDCDWSIHN